MSEPNVRLSEFAMAYVEAKAREGNATTDEFVEALVQKAIRREARDKRLVELALEGIESGPPAALDWDEIRREAKALLAARVRSE